MNTITQIVDAALVSIADLFSGLTCYGNYYQPQMPRALAEKKQDDE